MHLSAEYAFCVMSLQCSAFGNIALQIVFAISACMQIAFAICIALYVYSLPVHCIINVALHGGVLHCGKVQFIALLVTITFIALHL